MTNKRPLPFNDDVKALQQQTVLECTWTDIPEDVRNDVKQIWKDNEYGNDHYYFKYEREWCVDWMEDNYPALIKYLEAHKIENCLIHYWW